MPVPAVNVDGPGNSGQIPSLIDCLRKNLIYKMWLPYTHLMSILGRFVKNRRIALAEKHSGYSMRSVAKRIGIHHSYLSRLERGEYAPLSEERIRALAVLFGEDPELLMAIGGRLSDHIANLIASNPDKFLHFVTSMEEQTEYSKNEYLQRLTRRKEELETLTRLLRDQIYKNQALENKVREQEQIHHTILNNLRDVFVILFDNQLRILWTNTPISENSNSLLQNSHCESKQQDFDCSNYETVLRALQTKSIENGTYLSPDGKHWLLRSVPIMDANAKITQIVHLQFEVTELMKAKQDLEVSEERWKFAIEGSRESVWDYDVQTDAVHYGDSGFKMLGYSKNEMDSTCTQWMSLIHPEDISRVQNTLKAHIKGETEFYHCEYRVRCKNSAYKWILSRGKVVSRGILNFQMRIIGTHTDVTDRKIIEEKIRINEIFLETLLTSIQEGITVISPELKINYANIAIENEYKKFMPIIGKNCYEVYHQRNKPCINCPTIRALNSGEKHFEILEIKNSSNIKWIGLHSYPIKDSITGKISGVVEFAQNITELQNIKKNQILLSSIIENSQIICVIKDLELRIIAANKFFVNALGRTSTDEIIGKTDAEIFDINLNSEAVAVCMRDELKAQTLSPGLFVDREETIFFPDGKTRVLHTHKFPIFDENGVVISTANISTDITEKTHLQNAYKNIEQKYRDLFEGAPIGICTANAQHQYLSMNSSYAQLYGYSSPQEMMEARNTSLDVFVSPNDKATIQTLLQNNNIVTRFECQTRRKDGSIFWTTRTIRGIHDQYGNLEHYEAFVEEIDKSKKSDIHQI